MKLSYTFFFIAAQCEAIWQRSQPIQFDPLSCMPERPSKPQYHFEILYACRTKLYRSSRKDTTDVCNILWSHWKCQNFTERAGILWLHVQFIYELIDSNFYIFLSIFFFFILFFLLFFFLLLIDMQKVTALRNEIEIEIFENRETRN